MTVRRLLSRPSASWLLLSVVLVTTGCVRGGAGSTPSATPNPSPTASSPTATPSPSAKPTPSPTPSELITFDVTGSIGGHAVQGRVANASFAIPCATAGTGQIITVHWTGDAPVNTLLQGEIDFKAGTWTLGSTTAQGTATVGLEGGKASDALAATSGSVTTSPTGGIIDGTFTGGADSLHLSGSWTCPPQT
jgi:hypothetical protein